MKAARGAVLVVGLALVALSAHAQWRMTPDAQVGIGRLPFVVNDLEAGATTWRNLGFTVKDGDTDNGISNSYVKFEDGAAIELMAVPEAIDELTTQYREQLEAGEGPVRFALHAPEVGTVVQALEGSRYEYGPVSGTFKLRAFSFLFLDQPTIQPGDAAYAVHPNGAKAMSRVWIAMNNGKQLRDMLMGLGGYATSAKVYAPEAVQAYDLTLSNGQVLVLPRSSQLLRDRPIIGATFEVEDLDVVRKRLDLFQVPWTMGGVEDMSVIVAPDATRGMWVEFRE